MRIQLELPEENVKELKALMEEAHIETYKELFSNALTLLNWSIAEVKKGRIIGSIDEDQEKYRVLVMPILESVVSKRSQGKKPAEAAVR